MNQTEQTKMNYCVTCQKDYGNANITECPKCKGSIREIKATRLAELMRELSSVLAKMTPEHIKANPKELVSIAQTIEKGEKRLTKEYKYRMAALQELTYELSAITAFATKMQYDIGIEPKPQTEEIEEAVI